MNFAALFTLMAALVRYWPTVRLFLDTLLAFDSEAAKKIAKAIEEQTLDVAIQVARETKRTHMLEELVRKLRARRNAR